MTKNDEVVKRVAVGRNWQGQGPPERCGKAKGMSAGLSYTAAGYKAEGNSAEAAGARLLRNVQVQARIADLQGSTMP